MKKNNKKKKRNVKKPKYQKTYVHVWYTGVNIFTKILVFPIYLVILIIELIYFPLHKVFTFTNKVLFNNEQLSKMRNKTPNVDESAHFFIHNKI